MKKLIALTALYILGQWLQPGTEVPGDVPGFDYAKAYRKGMLEAEDGSEVENPLPPGQAAPVSPEPDSQFVTQSLELLKQHGELQQELATARQQLIQQGSLNEQLTVAREQLADYQSGAVVAQQEQAKLQAQLDQSAVTLAEAQAKVASLEARPALPDDAPTRINAVKGVGDTLAASILAALTKAD
ncbi:hypothetical protein GCM10022631_01780 [Deinococcus rubellus]|uniref:Uncharacterized protein n=1 Tax=Deinococcus rubellus TaxID=1889240 RepID=A0ABY5YI62_9DEIO|nr:hypothetical protein [Deinococcus rubellus]UWX64759.1 hypothetical protein N0D28_03610 [Deinococcus rubellus]